ncbi:MAG: hypothetical protein INR73_25315 [Williamsia sp.]|nr:hypothetical protein [Williamsia sp.]
MILFNHNHEQNLTQLDRIYKERFEKIWYIMPFYTGTRKDVVAVYESSFYFQGSIAKALEQVRDESFDHYMIVADDLLLNPAINQDNYLDYFSLDTKSAFIPGPFLLNDEQETRPYRPFAPYWFWIDAATDFTIDQRGIEVSAFLPTYDQAEKMLARHGLPFTQKVGRRMYLWKEVFSKSILKILSDKKLFKKFGVALFFFTKSLLFSKKIIRYPLIASYSDLIIVPHQSSYEFMRYCGVFGALNLFVEIAAPTALAFSAPKIVDETQLTRKGQLFWTPGDILSFETHYNNSLTSLLENFPPGALYVHPVKFGRWKP